LQTVVGEYFKSENTAVQTESFNTCDLLIIDDLGTELPSQYSKSALYNIIDTRTLNKKRMIISTNKTISELDEIYDQRIISRLIGDFTVLKFYGHDIRQQKLKRK